MSSRSVNTGNTGKMLGLRVLLCMANEEEATKLARALKASGLDALVAHSINGAIRVIQRESPQALLVEVGLDQFDGFRVAKTAIGQVHATFLISGRKLTLMEDVEVLKVGAKETFYKPVNAHTIAASVTGACGPETRDGLNTDEPLTRHAESPPTFAKTVARASSIDDVFDIPKTVMQPRSAAFTQKQAEPPSTFETDDADMTAPIPKPPTQSAEGERNPVSLPGDSLGSEPTAPLSDDQAPATEGTARSAALADEMFAEQAKAPISSAERPSRGSVGASRPRGSRRRKLIATGEDPTVDPTSIAELDDAMMAVSRSITRSKPKDSETDDTSVPDKEVTEEQSDPDEAKATTAETADEALKSSDEEVSIDPLDSRQRSEALDDAPKTSEILAAAYAPSPAATFVHKALLAAIVIVSCYISYRVLDHTVLSAPSSDVDDADSESLANSEPEESADGAEKKRTLRLHGLVSEATVAFRDGEYDQSTNLFRQVLKEEPEQKAAILGLASIAFKTDNLSGAQMWIENLAALYPEEASFHLRASLLRYASGDREGTVEALRQFLKIAGDEDPLLRHAARLHLHLTSSRPAP